MSKTIPISTIIAQFEKAAENHRVAKERTHAIACTALATFVTVPEFGAGHYFKPTELDFAAARHIKEKGLKRGTNAFAVFQKRIAGYKAALNQLALLRNEWKKASGLSAAWDAENLAAGAEYRIWNTLLRRLDCPQERPAIFRFLASGKFCLEPWRMRDALGMASKIGVR